MPPKAGRKRAAPKEELATRRESAEELGVHVINASDLPHVEKKPFNAWKNASHGAALDPGSKEVPEGKPNCLTGLTFVITGELAALSRDQASDLIKRYGGRVTSAVSGKTSYLVLGADPGQSKVEKAKKLNTKVLDEDGLYELIRRSKGISDEEVFEAEMAKQTKKPKRGHREMEGGVEVDSHQYQQQQKPQSQPPPPSADKAENARSKRIKTEHGSTAITTTTTAAAADMATISQKAESVSDAQARAELWTVRYKPKSLKQICGNRGKIEALHKWLESWANGPPAGEKAVLISGPPGIGKTTAAHLVAELLNYDVLELNASDTRNKSSLQNLLSEICGNSTIASFVSSSKGKTAKNKRCVVIMDEVDGMSGGDRGGMMELIQIIKKAKNPIICICNDRQSPKVRSLANHCLDLRFIRPDAKQIRSMVMTIAFREGLQVQPNAVDQIVAATHSDIRQIINILSTWSLTQKHMSFDQSKKFSEFNKKEITYGPFDVIGKYLNAASFNSLSFADKIDLYFNDFSLMPLMIQENYIGNQPSGCHQKGLSEADRKCLAIDQMSKAADAIAMGDIIDGAIHRSQQWGLLPVHGVMSCIAPAHYVQGAHVGMYRFPSWLGQNSKTGKMYRLLSEMQMHMRHATSCDKNELRQSYIPTLYRALFMPLIKEGTDGISQVIEMMDRYGMTKEDWDTLSDLHISTAKGDALFDKIPSSVKSAFTRQYNKMSHPLHFTDSKGAAKSPATSGASSQLTPDFEGIIVEDDSKDANNGEEEDEDEDNIAKDSLIKQKAAAKPKRAKTASSSSSDSSRGGKRRKTGRA